MVRVHEELKIGGPGLLSLSSVLKSTLGGGGQLRQDPQNVIIDSQGYSVRETAPRQRPRQQVAGILFGNLSTLLLSSGKFPVVPWEGIGGSGGMGKVVGMGCA